MLKNSLASEIRIIVKTCIFALLGILLMVLLLYGELAPKHYFKNITLLTLTFVIVPIISVILYLLFLKLHSSSVVLKSKYLRKSKVSWNFKIIVLFLTYCISDIIEPFIRNGISDNQKGLNDADNDFIKTLIGSGFQAPIIEEIVFRGLLFLVILTATSYLFNKRTNKHDIIGILIFIILSSFIFGLVHVIRYDDYLHIFPYILSGFSYSFVFIITRDIKVSIILHMLNNIPIVLNRYHYENIIVYMIVVFLILLGIAVYRYIKYGEYKN